MPMVAAGLTVAGALTGAIGGFIEQGQEKQVLKARQAMTDFQAQQQRLQQVRQSRIQQAKIAQAGVNQGVGSSESSSVRTGQSTVYGQAEANTQQISNEESIANSIFKEQKHTLNSDIFSDVSGFLSQTGSAASQLNPSYNSGS